MKKNVSIKSLLVIVLTLFMYCNALNDDDIDDSVMSKSDTTEDCQTATGYITKEEALKMEQFYINNQYKAINENLSDDPDYRDNRVVSFSIEEVECFFERAKKKAKAKGYDASKMRFKIYFAAKPDKNKAPKSTVFLVTTVRDSTKRVAVDSNFDEGGHYNYGNAGDGE